jgi:hypothetical protein
MELLACGFGKPLGFTEKQILAHTHQVPCRGMRNRVTCAGRVTLRPCSLAGEPVGNNLAARGDQGAHFRR